MTTGLRADSMLRLLETWLRRGPGRATMKDFERSLRRMHRADSVLAAQRHGYVMRPESVYVADYLRRLETTWRVRSALALGRVAFDYRGVAAAADDSATAILRRASQTVLPGVVLEAVQQALDTLHVQDSLPH